MAVIELEVIDNEPINCDYYGLLYESRIVKLVSDTSNQNVEMKQFVKAVMDAILYTTTKGPVAVHSYFQYLTALDKKIQATKQKLTTASKNQADARRAVKKLNGDVSNIKDPNIPTLNARLKKLKDKYHAAHRKYDEFFTALENTKHIETNVEKAIEYLVNQNKSYNDITPQDVINTAFGAAAFYDQLIHNGWKQVTRNSAVINHISQETFEDSELANDPDNDFKIALSEI